MTPDQNKFKGKPILSEAVLAHANCGHEAVWIWNCSICQEELIQSVREEEQEKEGINCYQHCEKAKLDEREKCAIIAEAAPYNLSGGHYGGPMSCEYGCSNVIADAIRGQK